MSILERLLQVGARGAFAAVFLTVVFTGVEVARRSRFNREFDRRTSYAILLAVLGGLILFLLLTR